MILPLLTTGLKIFQATRKKASSGSDAATKITSKQTTVSGKSVAKPKSNAIVKAQSNKISATKFLQTTPDPSKSKATAKGGIFEAFASIINAINKFLSNILSTLIADNKLTKKQSDDERKKLALVTKRQRESNLEEDDVGGETTTKSKSKSKGSFLDAIIKFITSIALGSLVLALYRRFSDIIKFFKDTYEVIKDVFERLGRYISPIWEVFKFLVDPVQGIADLIGLKPDTTDYASMIEKDLKDAESELEVETDNLSKILEQEKEGYEVVQETEGTNPLKLAVDFFLGLKRNANPLNILTGASKAEAGTLDGKPIAMDRSFAKGMIKEHEGLRLKVYQDSKGLKTVGYGHLIDADSPTDIRSLKVGDSITEERANQLFGRDFDEALNAARNIPGFFNSSKKQQAALIDLTFNMGPNWSDGFPSFVKAFATGNYEEAARQLEFADPDNRPGVKSGYVQDVGPRRSEPILNLIKDKGIDVNISPHLKNIEHLLSSQSNDLSKLSSKIASISMDEEEFDDSPIIVPIPKQKTKVVGGSGGGQMIVIGGDDVNSVIKKINLKNLQAV